MVNGFTIRRATGFGAMVLCAALVAAEPADPLLDAGRAKATADVAAGKLRHVFVLPEAFFLTWGPGSDESNLMDYYEAVMADRFGVQVDVVLMIPGPGSELRHACGYNGVTDPIIDKKFGPDTTDKAWQAACKLTHDERQKYLDGRKAPTTRATTRR